MRLKEEVTRVMVGIRMCVIQTRENAVMDGRIYAQDREKCAVQKRPPLCVADSLGTISVLKICASFTNTIATIVNRVLWKYGRPNARMVKEAVLQLTKRLGAMHHAYDPQPLRLLAAQEHVMVYMKDTRTNGSSWTRESSVWCI